MVLAVRAGQAVQETCRGVGLFIGMIFMANSGVLHFTRKHFDKNIEVWRDKGDGLPLTKITIPVTNFQHILRTCNALDEGTISDVRRDGGERAICSSREH